MNFHGQPRPGPYDNEPAGAHQDSSPLVSGYPAGMDGPVSTLKTMPVMNIMFFAAACGLVLGSLCSLSAGRFAAALPPFVFGGLLAILDIPFFHIKMFVDVKLYIGKYARILTRLTGKGVFFLFLGCSMLGAQWTVPTAGFALFLATMMSLLPVLVGAATVFIGVMKSFKLEKARHALTAAAPEQLYDQLALTDRGPQGGLSPAEFNELSSRSCGLKWEAADLKLIYNALLNDRISPILPPDPRPGFHDEPRISKEDFMNWIQTGWVFL